MVLLLLQLLLGAFLVLLLHHGICRVGLGELRLELPNKLI